ncbi:MAG: homoserine kinase [Pseudomonas sp.]|uniref:homoserine kinase n=1 Tax=Pseudomonas sp. TaxID=306 RepID=UPI0027341138|nr:homoserine kinase [Pseudomonas sp.]MDP3846754.1 homoserine kinase [Pseudomonas sp.]
MAVFTPLTRAQLEAFVQPYQLGQLLDYQPIVEGSENSNFFVSLEQGEFVLTLIERGQASELPFFIELLERLHQQDFAVPYAVPTADGQALRQLAGKPALLQPRLAGRHVQQPTPQHCRAVGAWLARLHLATTAQPLPRQTDRGLTWMLEQGRQQAAQLHPVAATLLRASLDEIPALQAALPHLPSANLHGDLFRDNVLFDGEQLSGVIDFYNACSGPMLYDLAIAVNDWCSLDDGELDPERCAALLTGYAQLRPFSGAEAELWPLMLRIACLRFWLSRLLASADYRGHSGQPKDPQQYQQLLACRWQTAPPLPG